MKVTIEFDGDEEREELRTALDGYKWKGAVWDLDQALRKITKYDNVYGKESTDQERELADRLRTELREILEQWNLNLE
jgi:hypothetical protein